MAILKLGPIAEAASGTIGGVVFASTKAGPVARGAPSRTKHHSQDHDEANAWFSSIRRAWASLTNEQRAAWSFAALTYPHSNRLGIQTRLSGHALFVKLNMIGTPLLYTWLDFPLYSDPPNFEQFEVVETFNAVMSLADGYQFEYVRRLNGLNNLALMYGARTFRDSPKRAPTSYKLIGVGIDLAIPPVQTFNVQWDFHIGAPQVGEFCFLKLIWTAKTGTYNLPQIYQIEVTA